jgi:hypothetical protein
MDTAEKSIGEKPTGEKATRAPKGIGAKKTSGKATELTEVKEEIDEKSGQTFVTCYLQRIAS